MIVERFEDELKKFNGSLFPSLDNLEVVEECENDRCGNGYVRYYDPKDDLNFGTIPCPDCQGTGKVTRAATWEDVVNYTIYRANNIFHFNVIAGEVDVVGIRLPSGGILRVKREE